MNKVFVYGSLLSGMGNHSLLSNSKKLGDSKSPTGFKMVDLGYFPGVVKSEDGVGDVVGEVYEVDDDTMRRLDRLEGYNSSNPENGFYNRIEIDTIFGSAFIYTINRSFIRNHNFVKNGDWKVHYSKKTYINTDSL
jgi:gamma-glutamylcyclotransferase (GGCT)/AIG2-like uncharacterized protein YtfP